jgi:hypothetical protein
MLKAAAHANASCAGGNSIKGTPAPALERHVIITLSPKAGDKENKE